MIQSIYKTYNIDILLSYLENVYLFISFLSTFLLSLCSTLRWGTLSENSRRVKYWSHNHRSFLTGQPDRATTVLGLLYISRRELLFLVAHSLTAGPNAAQQHSCARGAGRDSKSCSGTLQQHLGYSGTWTLLLPASGHFSVHCHPAVAAQVQEVLGLLFTNCKKRKLTYEEYSY